MEGFVLFLLVLFFLYHIVRAFTNDGGGAKGCLAAFGVICFILLVIFGSIIGSVF